MTLFPEVQKRAQAEIHSVVGSDRLPSFADRPNLPYVEAVVKEVFRWNPVAPLGKGLRRSSGRALIFFCCRVGVPHRLLEDDIYQGYLIPKGSVVISNIWYVTSPIRTPDKHLERLRNILHNPEVYSNPLQFDPSRHLPQAGKDASPDPRDFCFGFGRRYGGRFPLRHNLWSLI